MRVNPFPEVHPDHGIVGRRVWQTRPNELPRHRAATSSRSTPAAYRPPAWAPHARAGNHVGGESVLRENLQHPDVGRAAGSSAGECKADLPLTHNRSPTCIVAKTRRRTNTTPRMSRWEDSEGERRPEGIGPERKTRGPPRPSRRKTAVVPRDMQQLCGDRADGALIDGVLHAIGGRALFGAGHAFGVELEDVRANLCTQSAPHAKILINFRHGSSFSPDKILPKDTTPRNFIQPAGCHGFHLSDRSGIVGYSPRR